MSSRPDSRGRPKVDGLASGFAAQKAAIESTHNIANLDFKGVASAGVQDQGAVATARNRDVAAVVEVLRQAATPLSVADAAKQLQWDSQRAANALEWGGQSGALTFFSEGSKTMVTAARS
jgi:hypothetical protein